MNVIYGRVSTPKQKQDTQLKEGTKSFIDVCSGSIEFIKRPLAQKLILHLKSNPGTVTTVKDISRLGRNTKDLLNTIELFNLNGWTLKILNPGIETNTPVGKLIVTMLGAVYEMELNNIKERTQQGREIAKLQGKYKGRKKGTKTESKELLKKHFDIVNCLSLGMNISKTAQTTKKSRITVKKVKDTLEKV